MFRVRWARRALDELTTLWTEADSAHRQAITAASHGAEQSLRIDPHNQGESRPKKRRIMFVPPLTVTFRIEADGHTVSVLQVRPMRRRA